jgi:hypothetical protein
MFFIKLVEQNYVRARQYYYHYIYQKGFFVCDRNIKLPSNPYFTLFNDIDDILTLYSVTRRRHRKDP